MAWEIDWQNPNNTGQRVWARNPDGRTRSSREWHWVGTSYLRSRGINTPTYRADAWEIDWDQRKGKAVMARNPLSKMPSAREWHWIDMSTLAKAGIKWKPKRKRTGQWLNGRGYIEMSRMGMTEEEIALAEAHRLFLGPPTRQRVVKHRLEALKKHGALPQNAVVRHLNGIKTDNRHENLVLGTTQENTMDHNTARLMAMYWRECFEAAQKEIAALKHQIKSQ